MFAILAALLGALRSGLRSRLEVEAVILALRYQLAVLQRAAPKRPRLVPADRLLWVLLSTLWPHWRRAVEIVQPATVLRWHRRAFAIYWRWKSRPRQSGRPPVAPELRTLIRQMSQANPLWGAPRIHGELLKLGLTVSPTTVAKYLARRRRPPSPSWTAFLRNHVSQLASVDFFTVPTATFRVLFVFVVLSHDRRGIVHVNVTDHPTSAWARQQLREAFPLARETHGTMRDGLSPCLAQQPFRVSTTSGDSNARDRLDSRVPGPCDHLERAVIATNAPALPGVLPSLANAPGP